MNSGCDDVDAWVNRGVAPWQLGNVHAARRSFEKALDRNPGNARATSNLAALEKHAREPAAGR